MFASIQDAHIYEQINGHIQVWQKNGRNYAGHDLEKHLITRAEIDEIEAFAAADDRVEMAVRTLEVSGKIDYDGNSGNFMTNAMVPSEKETIHKRSTALRSKDGSFFQGEPITDEDAYALAIPPGMKDRMKLEVGDEVILITQSLDGQMNAGDAIVYQVLDVVSQALDNLYVYMPLSMAQGLYDTDSVSSVRLLLHNDDDTDAVLADFRKQFDDKEWDIYPWYDVSKLYKKTKTMFNIIFGLVFAIIAIIVTMSVINTIGMAVVERTREIGTLRAMGLKKPGVVNLFGVESALLGVIGAIIGLLITYGFAMIVHIIAPTWNPPVAAREVVWEIRLVPWYLTITSFLLILFTTIAAIGPARRAASRSIVDSLGHV